MTNKRKLLVALMFAAVALFSSANDSYAARKKIAPAPAIERAHEKLRKAAGISLEAMFADLEMIHVRFGRQKGWVGWWAEAWADGKMESAGGETLDDAIASAVDNWIKVYGKKGQQR